MSTLPLLPARKVIKTLKKFGFEVRRQTGSHIHLLSEDGKVLVTVPNHSELAKGTLNSVIKQSKLSREEFLSVL